MNPLPPIIPIAVPPALALAPPASPVAPPAPVQVPVFNASVAVVKKFVLCITKELKEDLALFKDYNVVQYDDNVHKNIPIANYDWDFLVLDLRNKGDRYCFMKEVAPNRALYNVIVYCHKFEVDDVDVDNDNAFATFPAKQATKEDFEKLLLMKRIKKPKWYVSLFGCILNYYNKVKN
jgi:hypothetical protein